MFLRYIISLLLLTSCASPPRTDLDLRSDAYKKILSMIEVGMTRKQLYALFPPMRRPIAKPPRITSICGGFVDFVSHRELYPLDRDFGILVTYRLATTNELAAYEALMRKGSKVKMRAILTGNHASWRDYVDALKNPGPEVKVPSRENMRDEVFFPPPTLTRMHPEPLCWGGMPLPSKSLVIDNSR